VGWCIETRLKLLGLLKDGELTLTADVNLNHQFDLSKLPGDKLEQLADIVGSLESRAAEANGTAHG
jgi:hypothetical protein